MHAASLCSPTFFSVDMALGQALRDLHEPVPGFEEAFLWRVERMFDNLPHGRIVERCNWTVLNSDDDFLPTSAPIRARVREIAPDWKATAWAPFSPASMAAAAVRTVARTETFMPT